MTKFISLIPALFLLTTGCASTTTAAQGTAKSVVEVVDTPTTSLPDRGVLFHLSAGPEDAHQIIHPLVRATNMSRMGVAVGVYLDIDAAPLGFTDGPNVVYNDLESKALINDAVESGVKFWVCGTCIGAHGKDSGSLLPGVKPGTVDDFFSLGNRIITFDY